MKEIRLFIGVLLGATLVMMWPVAVQAQEASTVTTLLSTDGGLLVVEDSTQRRMAIYRIQGDSVRLISSRDLRKDMSQQSTGGGAAASPAATVDVPGQDPPGWRGLDGAVRTRSESRFDPSGEDRWEVEYQVPGDQRSVYERIRSKMKDWTVRSESVGESRTWELRLQRERTVLQVGVRSLEPETGRVLVQVREIHEAP